MDTIIHYTPQHLFLLGTSVVALLLAVVLFALLRHITRRRLLRGVALSSVLLSLLTLLLFIADVQMVKHVRMREADDLVTPSNMVANPLFAYQAGSLLAWTVSGTVPLRQDYAGNSDMPSSIPPSLMLPPPISTTSSTVGLTNTVVFSVSTKITSSFMPVRAGAGYRYSVEFLPGESGRGYAVGYAQVRIVWLGMSMDVVSWHDSPVWLIEPMGSNDGSHIEELVAPKGAAFACLEIGSLGPGPIWVRAPKFSALAVHIEPNPNGTQGSLAFSFDWESAMGGAIHSKGMREHDASAAAKHGFEMRQGADWLNNLFHDTNIQATFYATGYNLLDGNVERRTFSGDPVYKWAAPKNRWDTEWWLTHKWYGDDPYGTYQSRPSWYFGDQTRRLLNAGHEIASHTFGHLYVRGSNPEELAIDMDEWLRAARSLGITTTTTFAFPWRSSNSLSADFYDVLYNRGIRAVTRTYEGDLKDLYTLGAPSVYPDISIMPEFQLGVPSTNAGEESVNKVIGLEEGRRVITETLARGGTTSFWTHPEQLADAPTQTQERDIWTKVVAEAAAQRDKGKLWIATIADITAYQRDIRSVTTSLDRGFLGMGGWKVQVRNDSGRELHGVTLTMPGDVQRVSSGVDVLTVQNANNAIRLSEPGRPVYPARQLVLPILPQGTTTLDVEWAQGQEPIQ
jgi:peptidoglycan/xylan/chitin deacetylase (PgdA/CDA1 family)